MAIYCQCLKPKPAESPKDYWSCLNCGKWLSPKDSEKASKK